MKKQNTEDCNAIRESDRQGGLCSSREAPEEEHREKQWNVQLHIVRCLKLWRTMNASRARFMKPTSRRMKRRRSKKANRNPNGTFFFVFLQLRTSWFTSTPTQKNFVKHTFRILYGNFNASSNTCTDQCWQRFTSGSCPVIQNALNKRLKVFIQEGHNHRQPRGRRVYCPVVGKVQTTSHCLSFIVETDCLAVKGDECVWSVQRIEEHQSACRLRLANGNPKERGINVRHTWFSYSDASAWRPPLSV